MTVNSHKLIDVQERLEKLLNDKKSLNSKVTADAFTQFKLSIEKVKSRTATDVKPSLKKLEQCLKNEGAYKNVKVGFEAAKSDILEILEDPDFLKEKSKIAARVSPSRSPNHRKQSTPRQANPRAVTVTLSNAYARQNARRHTHTIQRPTIEPDAPPAIRTRRAPVIDTRKASVSASSPEELMSLNKTISRLFTHLDIDKTIPENSTLKTSINTGGTQRTRYQRHRSPSPSRGYQRNEAEVKELVERLKKFEDAFHRKREKENEEILSLQTQLAKFKTQLSDLNKELERHRGIHSIANKAKGKRIEERYLEEKKDMELRIHELEQGIKKNDQIRNATELEMNTKGDIIKLRDEIRKLSNNLEGKPDDNNSRAVVKYRPKYRDKADGYDITELLNTLDTIGTEVKVLKDAHKEMESTIDDMTVWKLSFIDIESDIEKFYDDLSTDINIPDGIDAPRIGSKSPRDSRRKSKAGPLKMKLLKTKSVLQNSFQKLDDTERALKERTKLFEEARDELTKINDVIDGAFNDISDNNERENGKTTENSNTPIKSRLTSVDKVKLMKNRLNKYTGSLKTSDQHKQSVEHDFETLRSRILRFDTSITSGMTDDNIHGDTPTPRNSGKSTFTTEEQPDVSDRCRNLLKKMDVLQIGFQQIKEQNRELVNEANTLKTTTDAINKIRDEMIGLCKAVAVRPSTPKLNDPRYSDITKNVKLCTAAIERTASEVDLKEGIIQKTYSDLERLKDEIRRLWEFSQSLKSESAPSDDLSKQPREQVEAIRRTMAMQQKEITAIKSSLQEKENIIEEKEKESKELVTKLKKDAITREEVIMECKEDIERIKEEMSRNKIKYEQERKYTSEQHKYEVDTIETSRKEIKTKLNDIEKQLKDTEKDKSDLSQENNDLKTRLSTLAAANLGDGNPGITNLADPNRPTKISEYYTELYDNEWTNAYETLISSYYMDERSAITCLLDIAKECYEFCSTLAIGQFQDLQKVLFMLYKEDSPTSSLKEKVQSLTKQELKAIKELRKSVAPKAESSVFKILQSDDERMSVTDDRLRSCGPYINRCVELCWLMQVQDPPMYMNWSVRNGDKIDTAQFKLYTQSGDYVQFLVWPSLHLFKDGHLLAKGVVQAI